MIVRFSGSGWMDEHREVKGEMWGSNSVDPKYRHTRNVGGKSCSEQMKAWQQSRPSRRKIFF